MLSRFCPAVLEYGSAVWCSAADTHIKLLDREVSGARFLTEGVFECDIAHSRSVAVLCLLYKIRYNPTYPLNGALPGSYMPVLVTLGALVAHRYTYAPPRCRTSQHGIRQDFCSPVSLPLERSCWPRIRWCGTGRFQEQGQCFIIGLSCVISTIVVSIFLAFSSFCLLVGIVGLGSSDW